MAELIRPEPLGSVPVTAASGLLDESNSGLWSGGAAWIGARHAGELRVHARDRLLAGDPEPAWILPPSGPRSTPYAAVAPDGRSAVLAGSAGLRAVHPDGTTLWELAHDRWPHGSPPGPPSISPDGHHVSVVVPRLRTEPGPEHAVLTMDDGGPGYVSDEWLLLDATSGAVLRRVRVPSVAQGCVQRWHPDGRHVAVCVWTAWSSWRTVWLARDDERPWEGPSVRWVADVHPSGSPVYSIRQAELMFYDDVENSLVAHAFPDGAEVSRLDAAGFVVDEDDELVAAVLVDPERLVTSVARHPEAAAVHRLLDARTLRPLGEIGYPAPMWQHLAALGDGSWLTTDGAGLHRFRLLAR